MLKSHHVFFHHFPIFNRENCTIFGLHIIHVVPMGFSQRRSASSSASIVARSKSLKIPWKSHVSGCFPAFSHGFPMVCSIFPWFSQGFNCGVIARVRGGVPGRGRLQNRHLGPAAAGAGRFTEPKLGDNLENNMENSIITMDDIGIWWFTLGWYWDMVLVYLPTWWLVST